MMGESRQELLSWINDLLDLGYTRIEQFGTGAAHCQIIDSIYKDVPLSKVKFNAKHEYEYVQNFKVLQTAFDKHAIENHIPVDRLIKCKFQDNLEFLQLMKKIWDQYYPGGAYDCHARRKGQSVAPLGSNASLNKAAKAVSSSMGSLAKKPASPSTSSVRSSKTNVTAAPASSNNWTKEKQEMTVEFQRMITDLSQQNMELKSALDQATKEREFYYEKLREIESFVQFVKDSDKEHVIDDVLTHVLDVMYKTEDGFEVPAEGEIPAELATLTI